MTPAQFQGNAPLRDGLLAVLTSPAFEAAVDAVLKDHDAKTGPATDVNPVLAASKYQQRAGMNLLLSELLKLTKPAEEPKRIRTPQLARTEAELPPQ